jgi:hypothetical protein
MCLEAHKNRIFYCAQGAEKEGSYMQITQQSMQKVERMASFLFGLAQVALVLSLFWALKAHTV